MGIGTKTVCHIAFVTKDIHRFVDNWKKLLGLKEDPKIWNIPPKEIAPALTFGKLEDYHGCIISVIQLDNLVIEVVQPGEEPSPWKLKLERDGEGFQHIAFIVPDRDEALNTLAEMGISEPYHIGYYPGQTYSFYDTKALLGMEVNIKYNVDNVARIASLLKEEQ